MGLLRIDISPSDYVHVPQAPRIERREIFARDADNPWQMWGVSGLTAAGDRVGLSNHTWSHLDAPYHLLPDGAPFGSIDPRRYLASRTRVVDLTATDPARRETIENVSYHSIVDLEDLPGDLFAGGAAAPVYEAVLFVTGFSDLYSMGYPMREGADAHYPHLTEAAALRLASLPLLRLVAIDGPSVDKPHTHAAAHRVLLGRHPEPVLLLETLATTRFRSACQPLPREALLTVEPMRALGHVDQDGCLASVFAWVAEPGDEAALRALAETMRAARLVP